MQKNSKGLSEVREVWIDLHRDIYFALFLKKLISQSPGPTRKWSHAEEILPLFLGSYLSELGEFFLVRTHGLTWPEFRKWNEWKSMAVERPRGPLHYACVLCVTLHYKGREGATCIFCVRNFYFIYIYTLEISCDPPSVWSPATLCCIARFISAGLQVCCRQFAKLKEE